MNGHADYDPDDNGARCYALAIRALREMRIRAGAIEPDPTKPQELRWAEEGERSVAELETVRIPDGR
jgi:hypothetical protein